MSETEELEDALRIAPSDARRIIEHAVPRPATPIYSELSQTLQIALHRALTRQQEPRAALHPRPAPPFCSDRSQTLQSALRRGLTRQQEPRAALHQAGAAMRSLLARAELD